MNKFALIIDGIGTDDVRSYQTKKGKTYRLGTNIEYTPENPLASITNDCLISTYNFPQGRITDHRINFTAYNLEGVMNGQISSIIENLKLADQQAQLASFVE